MKNYTVDELSEMIVDSILQEQFLNKKTLVPKVKALIKTAVDLKNTPKNYNQIASPTKDAKRLRSLEQKECEQKYWMGIVKEIDPDNMTKYWIGLEARLVAKGFKEANMKHLLNIPAAKTPTP